MAMKANMHPPNLHTVFFIIVVPVKKNIFDILTKYGIEMRSTSVWNSVILF